MRNLITEIARLRAQAAFIAYTSNRTPLAQKWGSTASQCRPSFPPRLCCGRAPARRGLAQRACRLRRRRTRAPAAGARTACPPGATARGASPAGSAPCSRGGLSRRTGRAPSLSRRRRRTGARVSRSRKSRSAGRDRAMTSPFRTASAGNELAVAAEAGGGCGSTRGCGSGPREATLRG
ncbi:hypothetical protein CHC_T00008695001 [Chondrus crispus]|uniref:Uncharacterized protein n=1 Tax=Chondrus crispus TaxID=2769 RepID=R7QNJ1_CHOCR|nr:hypothetical protein CHC_T00008695001 [Chondrus crispus]CDF39674.1 hypothetical protein CHC_T00008695001 [Chondrus crispus]|eukprot:XP_005709968.1 hypothetical protein CHC_T00008695001 [Chondrus crispus]